MTKQKKIAAAISAVMTYIRTEEALIASQSMSLSQRPPLSAEQPASNLAGVWGISGRQSQMHLRMQMQMKAFHRFSNGNC